MNTLKLIRRIIFYLTIIIIVSSVFALTIGQIISVEFRNNNAKGDYYYFAFTSLPICILLSLIGTIKRKNSKARNWTIGICTIFSSVICFFILLNVMFKIGFGAWVNETILYCNKSNNQITINEQIFDAGALGYGSRRIVQTRPFFYYFQTIKQIDTTKLNKDEWKLINKEGDIREP
ncbi:MAG: hypothetical protein DI598_15905 [Pseudopedobacter saltans]|uniref:Uncharacterized protein n=1 Tax=Pseudopedobacter saltans TaxID=151895 RepID=A0A2W5EPX8_9SPHI|nr:MAG: hypothetical protein DI598_15905 [Pseudopedobacter saltans]